MDTQSLSAFLEVAESRSFSKAGIRLHLSQPAISKRIAALELALGTPLFDRIGRQIALTDAGHTLLPYARESLQQIEHGRRALSQLSGAVPGRLLIGTSHHIGLHRLPPVLRMFTQNYPDVDLDIHFLDSEDACTAVLQGKLELGIVTLPSQTLPNLRSQMIWPDPLVVVAAPNHPMLAEGAPKLSLLEVAQHPAVLPDEHTYTHRIITSALEQHGVAPRIRLSTNYLETLKMLVGIGLGWSVLPRSMLDASIVAVDLPELQMNRELGAVWHRSRAQSGAARALLKLLGVTA